jgi:hypothetical protein
MSYLALAILLLHTIAALMGSFTLVERRLVSAIRLGWLLIAECNIKIQKRFTWNA